MYPTLYSTRRVRRETADTLTVALTPADGTRGMAFAAGQFNMVYVPGVGEIPISISGNPSAPGTLIHTTRVVGAVSRAMGALTAGDVVGIRGPFGTGWPIDLAADGSDVVLVAGGIGFAPLRPALYRLLADRSRYGRLVLLYGTRTPADLLFRRELERWRGRMGLDVLVTVDRAESPALAAGAAMPHGQWHGNVGVVTTLIPKVSFDRQRAIAMICGPEVMMRFSAMTLEGAGMPAERIFLSMERNMKCGIGVCGHCQYGPSFVCKDGPVYRYDRIRHLLATREI